MQRDNAVLEISSGEDDETTTESQHTTAEFHVPDDLKQGKEEEPRRWKQAKAGWQSGPVKERRFSIGSKGQEAVVDGLMVEPGGSAMLEDVPKSSSERFIEEVRKKQRRATITRGKCVSEDIWKGGGGFGEFLESERFADLTVEMNGRRYRVHRLIVAFSSEYFARVLASKRPGGDETIVVDVADPENVMPDIVRYMYTSEIAISAEKAVPLLAMADMFGITDLKVELSTFISGNVRRENAVTLLRKALKFHADQIVSRCIDVVASNFAYIYDESYEFVPFHLFSRIIYHKQLNVLAEHDLYVVLRGYVRANGERLSEEERAHIMSAVRYRWLSIGELIEVRNEGLVPQKLLLEAAFARLEGHEQGAAAGPRVSQTAAHLQPRPVYSVSVGYQRVEKGIAPGICDWIGRAAGRRDWINPHVSGEIVVSASSLCKGVLADVLSTRENELWSNDVPASWFCLDFGVGRSVMVTSYVLRHGGNYRADSLRNWDLQGSTDGWHWEVLMSHRHDSSLQGPFALAHWEVPEARKAYRFVRVLQTGHNSSSRNFLVLSNIELFGEINGCQNSQTRLVAKKE